MAESADRRRCAFSPSLEACAARQPTRRRWRRWRGSRPRASKCSLYRDLAKLPPFNPDEDMEDKPKPEPVETLRALVDASDALIIAAPEYAHGLPGALKNALDWLVASETFAGKPTALINTSPRAFHAQASLREILSTMAARLIPEAFVSISLTGKAVDAGRYSGRHGLRAAAYGNRSRRSSPRQESARLVRGHLLGG